MIARTWKGITPGDKAEAYLDYLHRTGVKSCRETPGNLGVHVLQRRVEDRAEFLFISLWESMNAIRRFAGTDVERAVYFPEDREFLMEMAPCVEHYEVPIALPRSGHQELPFFSLIRGLS